MAIQVDKSVAVLPNIKKMFVPDPGYIIYDADLSGADAQVVAWEADDAQLKALFRAGENVHMANALDMFGARWTDAPGHHKSLGTPKGRMYYDLKRGVHLTNYIGSAKTLATTLGWSLHEAEDFQSRWFKKHPGIRDWHERVKLDLRTTGTVFNKCGYHRTYFDRPDSVLSEAIAWIPQSTIAIVCFRGAAQLRKANIVHFPNGPHALPKPAHKLLLQTHDSLTFEIKDNHHPASVLPLLRGTLANPIPYADPLTIQWKIAFSSKSWGEVEEPK